MVDVLFLSMVEMADVVVVSIDIRHGVSKYGEDGRCGGC